MKQYKTYQEAKIDNPNSSIVTTAPYWIGGVDLAGKFVVLTDRCGLNEQYGWIKCNPADYCMSLEQFFEAGHKLVDGDVYFNRFSSIVSVVGSSIIAKMANIRGDSDKDRYVLSAKALEKPSPEWANGDECYYKSNAQSVKFIGKCNIDNTYCWISICNDYAHVLRVKIGDLTKPETPQAKAKREALELFDTSEPCNVHDAIEVLSNAGMLKSKGEK